MIKLKKKICKTCGHKRYIFSHGNCLSCSSKTFKPIKKKKQVKQDDALLSQKETFLRSFLYWDSRNYLTGEKTVLTALKPHNFAHVLSKGEFKWFKYYFKNIVILNLPQHVLFDEFTDEKFQARKEEHPEEDWDKLFNYVTQLQQEYAVWIENNPHTYKL